MKPKKGGKPRGREGNVSHEVFLRPGALGRGWEEETASQCPRVCSRQLFLKFRNSTEKADQL